MSEFVTDLMFPRVSGWVFTWRKVYSDGTTSSIPSLVKGIVMISNEDMN